MASQPLIGTTYGVGTSATNHAHQRAVDEAIVLAGLTGTIYPAASQDYIQRASEQIIDRITAFAVHARRSVEISNTRNIQVRDSRWRVQNPGLSSTPETSFWTIVNRILHARNIRVVTFPPPGQHVFSALGDSVVTHVEVQSDQGGPVHFCPFALVFAYLEQIAPALTHPQNP